jgi:hypothetical protein
MATPIESPPIALHERLIGFCRRRVFATLLPPGLAALILAAEYLLPSSADYAAFLLVPLLLFTYCRGALYGVAFGWVVAGAEQIIRFHKLGGEISAATGVVNWVIWGTVATLLVLLTNSVLEVHALRLGYVQLRTLQQTMVTVNDIVRNRLGVLLALCDLLQEGRTPSPQQVSRARMVIEDIVHQLDRLGRLEVVTITEVAAGVEAVNLEAASSTPRAQKPPRP